MVTKIKSIEVGEYGEKVTYRLRVQLWIDGEKFSGSFVEKVFHVSD